MSQSKACLQSKSSTVAEVRVRGFGPLRCPAKNKQGMSGISGGSKTKLCSIAAHILYVTLRREVGVHDAEPVPSLSPLNMETIVAWVPQLGVIPCSHASL